MTTTQHSVWELKDHDNIFLLITFQGEGVECVCWDFIAKNKLSHKSIEK